MIQFFLIAMLLRSGITKSGNIKKCVSRRCKLCSHDMLQTDNNIVNYQTNETVVNQNNYTCSSKNLVYMICCNEKNCQFQYIGKTSQTLRARMNSHRSSLRTKKGCQFVIEHFTKQHRPANMKVVPLNPKTNMEMELIKEFGTLFPYGGNDRLEKPYLDAKEHFSNGKPVWNLFTHKKSRRGKRGGRNRNSSSASSNSTLSPQEIVDKVTLAKYQGENFRLIARNLVNSSSKEVILELGLSLKDCRDKQLRDMLIDLCRHYFNRDPPEKTPFKRDEHIVFKYTNRYFEDLNMAKLCNSPDILNSYPVRSVNFTPAFSYTKPIRNRVLNYIEESRSTDPPPVICDCSSSEFMDPTLQHVVTGNLAVIRNSKLRNLLNKGLTYRECHRWNKGDVLSSLEKDLDTHIVKQSEKKKTPVQCFQLWKSDLLAKVRNKLAHIKIRRFKKPVLLDKDILVELKKLQETFIIVPTDKAANNVSIVCRKYYHECMVKELSSNVYLPIQQNEETLVKQHQQDLQQLGMEVPADNESLPFIYSTIKQHKNPVSNRFIVSGRKCTTKTLSRRLLKVFQLVAKTMQTHSKYKCNFSNTKAFWVIKNAEDIRTDITNLNNKGKGSSVYSFDFSRLYTNIPHDLLRENIKFAVEEAFKVKADMEYIKVNKKSATWAKSKPKNTKVLYLSCTDIYEMLGYLLDNIYVKYRGNIFRQIIGVPMGTDCAPDLANLFLFVFEYKYVMNLISTGDSDMRLLRFVYRYIDDLLILNDNGNFANIYTDIYPDMMELKSTGSSAQHVSFLDMDIKALGNRFKYTLYDKRNDFEFKVISLPNLSGNIPINQAYGTFYSQIVRIFNANNTSDLFINNIKTLTDKLCKQGFNRRILFAYIDRFIRSYRFKIITKYWTILHSYMFVI